MADRYLVETSGTDGYLLEDGSGVLLLEGWTFTSTGTYDDEIIADGPTADVHLSEASGHFVDDAGGPDTNGEIGTTYRSTTGPITAETPNYACQNTSTTNYTFWLHWPVAGNRFKHGDVFSWEGWVKRTTTGIKCLFDTGATGGTGYSLWFDSSHNLRFAIGNAGGTLATSTVTVADTNWHHIVVTKNGSTRKIYIDGSDVTSLGTNTTVTDSTDEPYLGAFWDGQNPLDGHFARINSYDYDLSAARVLAHYNAATTIPATGLAFPYIGGGYYGQAT